MKINTQKGFIVPLIGGIVALLIAGGIYWAWHNKAANNTSVEVSNVSTTQSQFQEYKYGDFSIEYPNGWIINDLQPKNVDSDHIVIIKSPAWSTTTPVELGIEIWKAEGARTATSQIAMFSNPTYGSGLEKSNVKVGVIPAVEFSGVQDMTAYKGPYIKGSFIIFEKDGYTYTISASNVDPNIFQGFYESLKFTN